MMNNTNFQDLLVAPDDAIFVAMSVINKGAGQIALVVDSSSRLLGTVTDGDIRRAILQNTSVESPVKSIMNTQFHSAMINYDRTDLLEEMQKDRILQIPILDQDRRLLDLLLLQDLVSPPRISNPVVIMAGGLGKRLKPYTDHCPKPMLHVGGKPILEILIEQLISQGFSDFYISVNYLKEQIMSHFGDGSRLSVSIQYLLEDHPLGTAGSLSLLPDLINEPVVVMNGDILTNLDLTKVLHYHSSHSCGATICVRPHETYIPFGVVTTSGSKLVSLEEKPVYKHLVNAGVYVINHKCLKYCQKTEYLDMPSLLDTIACHSQDVTVYPIHEYWIDIGSLKPKRSSN